MTVSLIMGFPITWAHAEDGNEPVTLPMGLALLSSEAHQRPCLMTNFPPQQKLWASGHLA